MANQPNIVWIVADHLAYGNRPTLATAFKLQSRLAREGMCFSRAHTVLPVCSPARASMLTGVYPHAHGLTENDGRFGGRASINEAEWLLHQPLRQRGYRCAWFGKWHLDNNRSAHDYGFEGFSLPGYGYPYGTAEYRDYLRQICCSPPVAEVELPGESGLQKGTRINLTEAYKWFDYESGTALLDGPAKSHETFFLSHLATDWLNTVGDEPFFMRVDPWGPHPPYLVSRPFFGSVEAMGIDLGPNFDFELHQRPPHHRAYRDYWRKTLNFDASEWNLMAVRSLEHVAQVEAGLSNLLDALDHMGFAENTFVIFCADHGDAVASNGGIANKGGLMVEETMRIPLLLRGPGIPAGTTVGHLVSNMDIVPTVLEVSEILTHPEMHGQSLVPLFDNPNGAWRTGLMAQHYGLHEPVLQRAYYEKDWKLVVQEDGFLELYNLDNDPHEMHNLAFLNEFAHELECMKTGLRTTMIKTGDDGTRISNVIAPI
ncbi:sulfatase-like hydrolase/transferase [Pelagibius sp. Alg239-R121]|uniref:sulfatase-like hydrolase/transferase n=1 Tax=Pelagibius sp. Alg239-R121 TaxID=2993448 RepID=UPI0024A6359A|nr:sulfatase-like hydrolase/transferase [Pelagibius sp. Alg239-R121]